MATSEDNGEIEVPADALATRVEEDTYKSLREPGYTHHGALRFMSRFHQAFGRTAQVKDGRELLLKWNSTEIRPGNSGGWAYTLRWRSKRTTIIRDDIENGDVITVEIEGTL